MTEIEEEYAAADKAYRFNAADDSPRYLFDPYVGDVVEWMAEQDGDVFCEFLEDMERRARENKKATIYVLLADWLDKHYNEIRGFIN